MALDCPIHVPFEYLQWFHVIGESDVSQKSCGRPPSVPGALWLGLPPPAVQLTESFPQFQCEKPYLFSLWCWGQDTRGVLCPELNSQPFWPPVCFLLSSQG